MNFPASWSLQPTLSVSQSRPLAFQQNPYARRALYHKKRYSDHEVAGFRLLCLMLLGKIVGVFNRRSRKMRLQCQVLALLALGLIFLCLSRVLSTITTEETAHVEVQRNVQSQSRPLAADRKVHVEYEKGPVCGNRWTCRLGHMGFHLMAGFENSGKPQVCLNSKEIFKSGETGRGLNLAIVDGRVKEVIITKNVDTYLESPNTLVDFLKKIAPGDILIALTSDDAYRKLSKEIKEILVRDFNSRMIDKLAYRSAWAFIGQKGIRSSVELEKLNLVHGHWAEKTELRGCLSFPMDLNTSTIELRRDPATNCNLPDCANGTIPVSVLTGVSTQGVRQTPTVCVDGTQVMMASKKINGFEPGGRGLNCFIFDPGLMKVVKVGHFDTYLTTVDDTRLQKFLGGIEVGQIVIVAVHDEATKRLSITSKEALKILGSSKIDDFNFRDNWIFVGQRGIEGFSPYERLSFREGSGWGPQLELKECIPLKIEGVAVASAIVSKKRQDFCKMYNAYPDLCEGENINKTMHPLPLDDTSLRSNPVYKMPIVVVPGVDLEPLQKCLSSLIEVPGLKPNNVLVILNGNYAEPNDLVRLYEFNIEYIKPKADYSAFLYDAIKRAFELNKGKENLIILEDYLEVTPDFLRYFSQTFHMLAKDPTLLTISAWNPNGFQRTSGDEGLVYRTDNFPGFGWIARNSLWSKQLTKQKECCNQPTWRGWSVGDVKDAGSIIPDVSRIKRIPRTGGYYEDKRLMTDYLLNRISSSAGPLSEPTEVYKLQAKEYEREIVRLVSQSIPLKATLFTKCLQSKGADISLGLKENERNIYALFYKQEKVNDHNLLRKLCKCFGLFVYDDFPLANMHNGILRFTHKGNHIILVGSETVYYSSKPEAAEVLNSTDDKG